MLVCETSRVTHLNDVHGSSHSDHSFNILNRSEIWEHDYQSTQIQKC